MIECEISGGFGEGMWKWMERRFMDTIGEIEQPLPDQ